MQCKLWREKTIKIGKKGRGKGKARRPEGWEHDKNGRRRVEDGEEGTKGEEQANVEELLIMKITKLSLHGLMSLPRLLSCCWNRSTRRRPRGTDAARAALERRTEA